MDAQRLAWFRQQLLEERQRWRRQVEWLNEAGLGESMGRAYEEFSLYDNHPADAGTEMFEREKDLGLRANALRQIEAVDRALARMERGRYGVCEDCGQPIALERLAALPTAALCRPCKERQEQLPDQFHRPIEEKVLVPPFGRTFLDEDTFVGFEGEDALQMVFSYGSSDTPQDLPGAVTYEDLVRSQEQPGVADPLDPIADAKGEPLPADDPGRFLGP